MYIRNLFVIVFAWISVTACGQSEDQGILEFVKKENNLRSIYFLLECRDSVIETINIDKNRSEKDYAVSLMEEPRHFFDFKPTKESPQIDSEIQKYKTGNVRLYYWKKDDHLYGIICRSSLEEADFLEDVHPFGMMTKYYIIDLNNLLD
jgi:hypothetical protein